MRIRERFTFGLEIFGQDLAPDLCVNIRDPNMVFKYFSEPCGTNHLAGFIWIKKRWLANS